MSALQRDYLAKVQTAAGTLLGIINDILDFSKVEAGKMTLDLQAFRLDQLLNDLALILSASVGDKAIEVLVLLDPELPQLVQGDALRLRQVLLNLTGNAIKFTNEGEVVISVRCISRHDSSAHIEFSVRDTGIGIPQQQLQYIFQGFSQAETSTTRRFGGTGLGLAISQRLVQLMGGQLRVDSLVGQGSNFHFALAMQAIPEGSTGPTTALPATLQLHTLVVDDHTLARDNLCQMGRTLGWTCASASHGQQALAMLQAANDQPYDLILLDAMMPQMDGWQCARQISAQWPASHTRVVLMVSAHTRALLASRAQSDPVKVHGFIFKPVTLSVLRQLPGTLFPLTSGQFSAHAAALDSAGNPVAGLADDGEATVIARLAHQGVDPTQNSLENTVANKPENMPGNKLETARPVLAGLCGLRLLLVEDNDLNQQVASALLDLQGAQVTIAGNGKIALDLLQNAPEAFDLILMDLQMPVLDGFEATRQLRQRPGMATIPVIAMTANAMESDRQACLAAGMNDHVAKPFQLQQLMEVILRHVSLPDPAIATGSAGTDLTESTLPGAIANTNTSANTSSSATILNPAANRPPPAVLQLAQQHELDLLTALARLESNPTFLPTALRIFASDARRMAEQIEPSLQAQQGPDLLRLLHTLKGTAAIVGADKLAERAQALEAILRNDANLSVLGILAPEFTALGQSLLQTSQAISAMLALWDGAASQLPSDPAPPAIAAQGASQANTAATNLATAQSATLGNDLLLLIELLQASNMAALDLQRQLHPDLILLDAELASSLDDTMEQFNFAAAAAHCQRLLQFLDGASHARMEQSRKFKS